MPTGNCGLCGTSADLKDSHLLPKSIYKRLRNAIEHAGHKNPNPLIVTAEVTVASSRQVTDYFLCESCEQRFSSGGEKWMAENCWQADNTFPLRDALQAVKPAHLGKDGAQFHEATAIKGVDVQQIVYFASSVFWRAAAHQFSEVLGSKPQKLMLGPYEEELRQFLLGKAAFPKHASLIVTVSSESDDSANEVSLFPFLRNKNSGSMEYGFAIPGIGFQLFLGKSISKECAALSIALDPKHVIVLGPFDGVLRDMWKLISKSKKK